MEVREAAEQGEQHPKAKGEAAEAEVEAAPQRAREPVQPTAEASRAQNRNLGYSTLKLRLEEELQYCILLVANIGIDTAENGPSNVWATNPQPPTFSPGSNKHLRQRRPPSMGCNMSILRGSRAKPAWWAAR